MKKEYIDKLKLIKQDENGLNGQRWYLLQATKAVNQAISKIISHKQDYGSIILLDERYLNEQQKYQFTHWFKHTIRTFDDVLKSRSFHFEHFQKMKDRKLTPILKRYDQVQLKYAYVDQLHYLFEIQKSVKKAHDLYDMKFGYMKQVPDTLDKIKKSANRSSRSKSRSRKSTNTSNSHSANINSENLNNARSEFDELVKNMNLGKLIKKEPNEQDYEFDAQLQKIKQSENEFENVSICL